MSLADFTSRQHLTQLITSSSLEHECYEPCGFLNVQGSTHCSACLLVFPSTSLAIIRLVPKLFHLWLISNCWSAKELEPWVLFSSLSIFYSWVTLSIPLLANLVYDFILPPSVAAMSFLLVYSIICLTLQCGCVFVISVHVQNRVFSSKLFSIPPRLSKWHSYPLSFSSQEPQRQS